MRFAAAVSPPARVAWIETDWKPVTLSPRGCRRPRGWRGLKRHYFDIATWLASRRPRGWRGWNILTAAAAEPSSGRRPRGWRGLKHFWPGRQSAPHCRRPRGWRGLKHRGIRAPLAVVQSPPARVAWIETSDIFPITY